MKESRFMQFRSIAIEIAKKLSASIDDEQSDDFTKKIYSEYLSSEGCDQTEWISKRLRESYRFMVSPPVWVGEPRWAYLLDEPMIFLSQFNVCHSDKKLAKLFPMGDTVYIFGSKYPPNPSPQDTWKTAYKLVVQTDCGDDVVLEGDLSLA